MEHKIRVFVTGGTFDKEYNELMVAYILKKRIYMRC